jgi:hypothetical protein
VVWSSPFLGIAHVQSLSCSGSDVEVDFSRGLGPRP